MWIERRYLRNLDPLLVLALLALQALGLVVLSSAAGERLSDLADPRAWTAPGALGFVHRQLLWAVLGWVALAATLLVDYQALPRWTGVIYGLNLAMLGAVLVVGDARLGAQRWIDLGPFQFQPSEFSKLAMIATLAAVLARIEGPRWEWRDLVRPLAYLGPSMLLILKQPDLGTSLVLLAIFGAMLLAGRMPLGRLFAVAAAGLTVAVGWVTLHLTRGVWIPLKEYQVLRLIVFLDPTADRQGAGYQIVQSQYAIGSGGAFGRGLYQGVQGRLDYLPEQHTDFIFSVAGEELGFAGATLVLLLFGLLIYRMLRAALLAKDEHGALLAAGAAGTLAFHVIVNVGMTVGLMPVTGVPLPFLSYGGSAMISNCMAVGLALNVGMRRRKILFG